MGRTLVSLEREPHQLKAMAVLRAWRCVPSAALLRGVPTSSCAGVTLCCALVASCHHADQLRRWDPLFPLSARHWRGVQLEELESPSSDEAELVVESAASAWPLGGKQRLQRRALSRSTAVLKYLQLA